MNDGSKLESQQIFTYVLLNPLNNHIMWQINSVEFSYTYKTQCTWNYHSTLSYCLHKSLKKYMQMNVIM